MNFIIYRFYYYYFECNALRFYPKQCGIQTFANQDVLVDQNLDLQNSFDILDDDIETIEGEALPDDSSTLEVSTGLQDAPINSPNVTVDKVAAPKALDPVKVATWAATPVLSPICLPAPVTLDISTYHQPVTQSLYATAPMPQPITTSYDSLTSDKLPFKPNS